jgi:uncharacterized OB-fold protein
MSDTGDTGNLHNMRDIDEKSKSASKSKGLDVSGRRELLFSTCLQCASCWFPRRYLCPNCGHDDFVATPAANAELAQMTWVTHGAGSAGAPRAFATVRSELGPTVVALLETSSLLAPGTPVRLWVDSKGGIIAEPLV